ncbi:MAG: tetratricopeptide repeat protein [Pirellulales bacterium]|nr:tetratricopeptide repeat protein [Pirellulales bacterium]
MTLSGELFNRRDTEDAGVMFGARVAIVGRLAGMSKRDAQKLLRQRGALVVETADEALDLVVLGEESWPLEAPWTDALDNLLLARAERGEVAVINETELWRRLGLVDGEHQIRRLYTPAMLAELLGVSIAVVRRWHRRGLIQPARQVRRLPYFDFEEVASARRLAALLSAGMSPQSIERKLAQLRRWLPGVERPLAQLSVIVEGQQLLLRQGEGLLELGGQLRFDWEGPPRLSIEAPSSASRADSPVAAPIRAPHALGKALPVAKSTPSDPSQQRPDQGADDLLAAAGDLEDAGELEDALALYRAALAAGGPHPEICFRLAELLYRLGDLAAARERYYMAIELDEDYVEARANLGCVLAELGEPELAVAAFEGALTHHPEYPDAHYHLARLLDDLGMSPAAVPHWEAFLAQAPDSPWAEAARQRLGLE